jgi:hypothetical protein
MGPSNQRIIGQIFYIPSAGVVDPDLYVFGPPGPEKVIMR